MKREAKVLCVCRDGKLTSKAGDGDVVISIDYGRAMVDGKEVSTTCFTVYPPLEGDITEAQRVGTMDYIRISAEATLRKSALGAKVSDVVSIKKGSNKTGSYVKVVVIDTPRGYKSDVFDALYRAMELFLADPDGKKDPADPDGKKDPADPDGKKDPVDPDGKKDPINPDKKDPDSKKPAPAPASDNAYKVKTKWTAEAIRAEVRKGLVD